MNKSPLTLTSVPNDIWTSEKKNMTLLFHFYFFTRTAFSFPINKSTDSKTTSGVVRPLISEVRPLMENKSPGKQQESQGSERTTGQRLIQKKRTPVMDSRRLISPVAKAAASYNSSAGMRKAQSIHNISSEGKASMNLRYRIQDFVLY